MRKYILRYLIFWAPALLASYLLSGADMPSQIIQWFCGFLMLLGWCVNTGMCAYHYPRSALAALLAYFGVCIQLIMGLRNSSYGSARYFFFDHAAGIFTYRPLNMIYQALLDFSIFQEMWVTYILVGCCAVGYLCGLLYRRVHPNPYRPKIYRPQ